MQALREKHFPITVRSQWTQLLLSRITQNESYNGTRICYRLKKQLFLYGIAFRPHVSSKNGHQKLFKTLILQTLFSRSRVDQWKHKCSKTMTSKYLISRGLRTFHCHQDIYMYMYLKLTFSSSKMFQFVISEYKFIGRTSFTAGLGIEMLNESTKARQRSRKEDFRGSDLKTSK